MIKNIILLFTALTLFACTNTSNKNESSLAYINKQRIVYYQNDSLNINPFEQFNIVKLESIENEMHLSLVFKVIDTIQTTFVNDKKMKLNSSKFEGSVYDHSVFIEGNEFKYDNTSTSLKLKTVDGYLERKIDIGKEYKMIYSFHSDSEFHRLEPASDDYYDGYYIVDILPLNEKFEREKIKQ